MASWNSSMLKKASMVMMPLLVDTAHQTLSQVGLLVKVTKPGGLAVVSALGFEKAHALTESGRLFLHAFGSGRGLLDQRRILLRDFVDL